jgi:CRP-like cAMP-binding protein
MDTFKPVITNYARGAYIVVEGKLNADRFYIIQKGSVRITRDIDALIGEKQGISGAGDFIGAVSGMSGYSYIETAEALTDVVLLEVERAQYPGFIESNPGIAVKIVRQFSQRLRELDKLLSRKALSADAGDGPAHILQVANYYAGQKKFNQAFYAYGRYAAYCPGAPDFEDVKQKMMEAAPLVTAKKPRYPPDRMSRTYPKDTLIFAEGEPGDELYIIQNGTVTITKIADNQEVVLAVLTKGHIFGEMAMLEDKPRAANAEVSEDCAVLAVNRKNFEAVSRDQPEVISRLTSVMAERIWIIYKQIATTLVAAPMGRMYSALLVQLEKDRIPLNHGQSYQCGFGFKELSGMAGIPAAEGEAHAQKMLSAGCIQLENGKISIPDTLELKQESDYVLRMWKLNRNK